MPIHKTEIAARIVALWHSITGLAMLIDRRTNSAIFVVADHVISVIAVTQHDTITRIDDHRLRGASTPWVAAVRFQVAGNYKTKSRRRLTSRFIPVRGVFPVPPSIIQPVAGIFTIIYIHTR